MDPGCDETLPDQRSVWVRVGKLSHGASFSENQYVSPEEQNRMAGRLTSSGCAQGCSDLGRTVQVRDLYLCEWGAPISHHVEPG